MRGIGMVVYGTEGVGKTTWACQWHKVGSVKVIQVDEHGIEDLQMIGAVPDDINCVNVDNYEELEHETNNCQEDTLVVDNLLGVQTDLFDYVCRTVYNGRWDGKDSFTAYWKGQRVDSPPVFNKWLDKLSRLQSMGKHIILIGHVYTTELPNTLGADYKSHVVALDDGDKGGLRSSLMRWASNVFFMNINVDIEVATSTERGKVTAGKAIDTDKRLMYTHKAPGHAAKNRLNLPPVISMGDSPEEGFDNFIKKLPDRVKENL